MDEQRVREIAERLVEIGRLTGHYGQWSPGYYDLKREQAILTAELVAALTPKPRAGAGSLTRDKALAYLRALDHDDGACVELGSFTGGAYARALAVGLRQRQGRSRVRDDKGAARGE